MKEIKKFRKEVIYLAKTSDKGIFISDSGSRIYGSKSDLMSFVSMIIHILKKDLSKEEIKKCVELGLKSDEELNKEAKRVIEEVFDKIASKLGEKDE